MAKPWSQVEQSDGYQTLSEIDKLSAKKEYFDTVVKSKKEYSSLPVADKIAAENEFLGNVAQETQQSTQQSQQQMAYLPGRNKVEEQIAQRPNQFQGLKDVAGEFLRKPITNPLEAMQRQGRFAGGLLNAAVGTVEQPIANALLQAQTGNVGLRNMGQALKTGITGERPGQLGDIMRSVGTPEPIAVATGMLGLAGLGGGLRGSSVLKQSPLESLGQAGGELSSIGKAISGGAVKVKNFGWDMVNRGKASYVTDEVAPKAYGVFQENIQNFTPQIQAYAKNELKIPENAIKTIKNNGVNDIVETSAKYGNSTDGFYQTIENGFVNKRNIANNSYRMVMDNAPEGKQINIRPAIEESGKRLKKLGLITEKGNLTQLGQSEIARDSVYGKLLDFYKSADSISGVKNLQGKSLTDFQMTKALKATRETLVNKDQYTFLRDKLNNLYKNKPSDVDVSKVVNQFYTDGETSGIKGLQEVRSLQRKTFQAEENLYNKSLIKEKKLDKFHTFSEAEKRQLTNIEEYIGEPFVNDLNKVTAKQYLNKINEGKSIDNFISDLNAAKNREYTDFIMDKYSKILGKENANAIKKEIIAARRARLGRKITIGGTGVAGEEVLRRNIWRR